MRPRIFKPDGFDATYNGQWAWIAAKVDFAAPLNNTCYFGLSFDPPKGADHVQAYTTFIFGRNRAPLFATFKTIFSKVDHYYKSDDDREAGFRWICTGNFSLDTEFKKMINYVIDFWNQVGGWEKVNRPKDEGASMVDGPSEPTQPL